MVDNIRFAADEVLGANSLTGSNLFDPIPFPSGLDSSTYATMARRVLDDTVDRQRKVSSSLKDRLDQEDTLRKLEVQKTQDSALDELNKLDPLDKNFSQDVAMFAEVAAYSPAIANALSAKQNLARNYNTILGGVVKDLGASNLTGEETALTYSMAESLLKQGGPSGRVLNIFRANLARKAINDTQERQLQFNKSKASTYDALEPKLINIVGEIDGVNSVEELADLVAPTSKLVDLSETTPEEREALKRNYNISKDDLKILDGSDGGTLENKQIKVTERKDMLEQNLFNSYFQNEDIKEEDKEKLYRDLLSFDDPQAFLGSGILSDYLNTSSVYEAAKAQAKSNDQDLSLSLNDFKDENEVGFEQHEQEVADKKARATDIFNKIKNLRDNKSKASAYFGSRAGRKKLEDLRALQNSRRPIVESASNIDPSETSAGKAFLDSLQNRQVFGDISAGR
jgi:hypothetical protein